MHYLVKLRKQEPWDPGIPFLGMYPEEMQVAYPRIIYRNIYSSITCNCNVCTLETTQMPMNSGMDKYIPMVDLCTGVYETTFKNGYRHFQQHTCILQTAEKRKQDTKEYIQDDSIYIKFKLREM